MGFELVRNDFSWWNLCKRRANDSEGKRNNPSVSSQTKSGSLSIGPFGLKTLKREPLPSAALPDSDMHSARAVVVVPSHSGVRRARRRVTVPGVCTSWNGHSKSAGPTDEGDGRQDGKYRMRRCDTPLQVSLRSAANQRNHPKRKVHALSRAKRGMVEGGITKVANATENRQEAVPRMKSIGGGWLDNLCVGRKCHR